MGNKKKVLLLMSGGRDSFLSAALLIEQEFFVSMITFDNGHTEGIDRVKSTANLIIERYGEDCAEFLPIQYTKGTVWSNLNPLFTTNISKFSKIYPDIKLNQITCLSCKSAMYAKAIKYCLDNNIRYLADGARECQGFFVDTVNMIELYKEICRKNNIELLLPVFDLASDLERKYMLADRGLPTKTLEPQCFLGFPMTEKLTENDIKTLRQYFIDNILQKM